MSIMLDNHMMDQVVISGGFLRRSKITPAIMNGGDRAMVRVVVTEERENGLVPDLCSSSSSSSIGMNSDDDHDDDDEIESKLEKNSPFNSAVDALEQALPMRRGISNFYCGKSKSFASLGDAACSSIKDITKPENAYSRKRKNLLANSIFNDKGRTPPLKISVIGGGIEKRSTNTNRSTLAVAVAMKNHENSNERQNSKTPSISPPSSPVPPPPWRSFSLVDLQHCAVSASTLNSNLCSSFMGKRTKRDEVS
ncbi:hypothetical protein RND81_08G189700 [Saponaria officinalis]|uniref:Uncharacterized protein n=1 Tax=Saponaria officinalis TaxID=3572 RepID=A0AAW1JAU2_SAPOF